MPSKNIFNTLLKPVYSEKSTFMNGMSKYVFLVDSFANKVDVKNAVESVFDVQVTSVNIMRKKGKSKRFKGTLGKRPDRKKAIVSLKEGYSIELVSGD